MTRTSFDMELDLQASQTKLSHLNDENTRLRELKKRLEEAKARGLYKHLQRIHSLTLCQTGPCRAVGKVSGNRCESDCRSRGLDFDPGMVPFFRGD